MAARSVTDLNLSGKKAFIRVDFNVPIKDGRISEDTRVRASLPTIRYALDKGATVILASHLGRPKGKPNPEYSLRPVASRLSAWPALAVLSSRVGHDASIDYLWQEILAAMPDDRRRTLAAGE